jgi:F-type H+-transporting ATPase subunit beta
VYVPIDETVRSFREVLDGKHDELPESAFFMKGGIDAVVEAASKGDRRKEEPKQEAERDEEQTGEDGGENGGDEG